VKTERTKSKEERIVTKSYILTSVEDYHSQIEVTKKMDNDKREEYRRRIIKEKEEQLQANMLNLAALTSDTQPIDDVANALDDGDKHKRKVKK
jgi:hypothetical protein